MTQSKTIHAPYHSELRCPFCCSTIVTRVHITINKTDIRKVGSAGFNSPVFTTTIDGEISKVEIFHECSGPKAKE